MNHRSCRNRVPWPCTSDEPRGVVVLLARLPRHILPQQCVIEFVRRRRDCCSGSVLPGRSCRGANQPSGRLLEDGSFANASLLFHGPFVNSIDLFLVSRWIRTRWSTARAQRDRPASSQSAPKAIHIALFLANGLCAVPERGLRAEGRETLVWLLSCFALCKYRAAL